MATSTVSLRGSFDSSEVVVNPPFTAGSRATIKGTLAVGSGAVVNDGVSNAEAHGFNAEAAHSNSFVWNGNRSQNYLSKGDGTFSLNPAQGKDGVFIGDRTLPEVIREVSPDVRKTLNTGTNSFMYPSDFSNTLRVVGTVSELTVEGGVVYVDGVESSGAGVFFRYGTSTDLQPSASIRQESVGKLVLHGDNGVFSDMPQMSDSTNSTEVATVGFVNRRVSQSMSNPSLESYDTTFATTKFSHDLISEYLDAIFSSTDSNGERHSVIRDKQQLLSTAMLLGSPDYSRKEELDATTLVSGYQFPEDGWLFIKVKTLDYVYSQVDNGSDPVPGTEYFTYDSGVWTSVGELDAFAPGTSYYTRSVPEYAQLEIGGSLGEEGSGTCVAFVERGEVETFSIPVARGSRITYVFGMDFLQSSFVPVTTVSEAGQHDLFDMKWLDYELPEDSLWMRQRGWEWISAVDDEGKDTLAAQAFEHLYMDAMNGSRISELVQLADGGRQLISYIRAADGHLVVLADSSDASSLDALKRIFNANGVAWYYVVDENARKFQLPHTSLAFNAIHMESDALPGSSSRGALPNIKGDFAVLGYNDRDANGAFTKTPTDHYNGYQAYDYGIRWNRVDFDASRCSPLYQSGVNYVRSAGTYAYLYFFVGGQQDLYRYVVSFSRTVDGTPYGVTRRDEFQSGRMFTLGSPSDYFDGEPPYSDFAGWVRNGSYAANVGETFQVFDDMQFTAAYNVKYRVRFWNTVGSLSLAAEYTIKGQEIYDANGYRVDRGKVYGDGGVLLKNVVVPPSATHVDGYDVSWVWSYADGSGTHESDAEITAYVRNGTSTVADYSTLYEGIGYILDVKAAYATQLDEIAEVGEDDQVVELIDNDAETEVYFNGYNSDVMVVETEGFSSEVASSAELGYFTESKTLYKVVDESFNPSFDYYTLKAQSDSCVFVMVGENDEFDPAETYYVRKSSGEMVVVAISQFFDGTKYYYRLDDSTIEKAVISSFDPTKTYYRLGEVAFNRENGISSFVEGVDYFRYDRYYPSSTNMVLLALGTDGDSVVVLDVSDGDEEYSDSWTELGPLLDVADWS